MSYVFIYSGETKTGRRLITMDPLRRVVEEGGGDMANGK